MVQSGRTSVEEALEALAVLPFADIGHTVVDHHRGLRTGFPEVIFGQGKSAEQIASIVVEMAKNGGNVLVTRVDEDKAERVLEKVGAMEHSKQARCLLLRQKTVEKVGRAPIAVVSAGTSDMAVAEEAALVAELGGSDVRRYFDVGVAGIHRLFHRLDALRECGVIVVVAGMEGALASVVAGLVSCPVIGVPTSVGYGVATGGVTALHAMLSSCAPGVLVVNIDNGFGAGYAAALINRQGKN
jgi:NCAIR mutase (PurE)-related protein